MTESRSELQQARDLFPERRHFDVGAYNYPHFRFKHVRFDAQQTARRGGLQPAELAPDFELLRVGGGSLRLSRLRDKPVLLHFGSFT